MHVMEALKQLRDADQEWATKGQEYALLRDRLTDQSELTARRLALAERQAQLAETRGQLTAAELELRGLEARLKEENRELYADGNLSPRELDHLRRDAELTAQHIGTLEERVLGLMAQLEQLDSEATRQASELAAFEEASAAQNAEGMARYRVLRVELQALKERREGLRGAIAPQVLHLYEDLWRSKQGAPLAVMVDGRCETCRVNIPKEKARIVESYEPRVVTCDGCGRILILG
jgi:hypothetical protein